MASAVESYIPGSLPTRSVQVKIGNVVKALLKLESMTHVLFEATDPVLRVLTGSIRRFCLSYTINEQTKTSSPTI